MATKTDVLKHAFRTGAYRNRRWMLRVFTAQSDSNLAGEDNGMVWVKDGGELHLQLLDPEFANAETLIMGHKAGEPLFTPTDPITIDSSWGIPNIKTKVETTVGRWLTNLFMLADPFGDMYPFKNEEIDPAKFSHQAAADLQADKVTVEQVQRFFNNMQYLSSFTSVFVAAASEKSITTDPAIKKRRKELLEEHKDKLDDPATISKIEQELTAMDRAYIKGDVSEKFYKSGKSFNITRKQMHVISGGEPDPKDPTKMVLVDKSLGEGWDMDKLPEQFNTVRDGSYSRGKDTALGGQAVKDITRATQNIKISEPDCGDKLGFEIEVTKYNKDMLAGRYLVGQKESVDQVWLNKNVGKPFTFRSPATCKTGDGNFCGVCMGDKIASDPNSPSMLSVEVGSIFMNSMMKAMHGVELLTTEYDPFEQIV